MDNPYWHPEEKNHTVNGDDIRLLAFDIFNIVRASMSMMGDGLHEQPDEDDDREPSPVEALHYLYAEPELSKKLLQLSILLRTLDDYWLDYGDPHPIWYSVISGVRSGYGPARTGLQTRSA